MNILIPRILLAITLIALLATVTVSVDKNRINYSCIGEYSADITYPGVSLSSQINIMTSSSRAKQIHVSFDGAVSFNGKNYHINREVVFNYEVIDRKGGLLRIIPFYQNLSANDTVEDKEVESFLLGIEKEGRMIRIWKLSEKTVLIGNPYSPIFSCILLG